MKKQFLILIILSFAVVLGLILFSLKGVEKVDQDVRKVIMPEAQKIKPIERPARKLEPARPEDYGMIVTDTDAPASQEQWEALIRRKITDLKSQYPPQTWDKIHEKIKEDPAVTGKKIKEIEAGIENCRQILEKEPDNLEVKQRLERLMILQSIGEELPSRN
ncbi:MAG: hypothetical protein H8D90_01360 [Candidatus Omnitrophica bacterium]|nr:hypothetical protein [Candidatus Omnitrophota bacterium]MBL7151596.1 hypothetical protein [Candidatus Omnitrophota bacterium]